MSEALEIQRIEARQAEIKAQMEMLQAEFEENGTALRVFARFSDGRDTKSKASASAGASRPDGLPTIFEMVEAVLNTSAETSSHGLTGKEIVEAISQRYWPGLIASQILPSVYRFTKQKRLRKTKGGKFSTVDQGSNAPTENEAPAGASEAKTGSAEDAPGFHYSNPAHRRQ